MPAHLILSLSRLDFRLHVYRAPNELTEHIAIVKGDVHDQERVLVRVHSECLTGDVFGSARCDCGTQLEAALDGIAAAGPGVVVYLRGHEGRGIGLTNKSCAYGLQDQRRDTVEANFDLGLPVDSRHYRSAVQILTHLGVRTVRLMANNPANMKQLTEHGMKMVERWPVIVPHTLHNVAYLHAKPSKMGYLLQPS